MKREKEFMSNYTYIVIKVYVDSNKVLCFISSILFNIWAR